MTTFPKHELLIIALVMLASLMLATSAPLLTYSVGLACFGFMHIVREMYFLDHRFGARIGRPFAFTLGGLLVLVMLTRAASVFAFVNASLTYPIELALVVALTLSTLLFLPAGPTLSRSRGAVAFFAVLLSLGFIASPNITIVTLAVFHNLTPLGFMLEIAKPEEKTYTLLWCSFAFVVLPVAIACGVFNPFAALFGHIDNFSILPTGALDKHLGVFLPGSLRSMPWATQAFCAVVFAQCMHYLAVIYVMPKLLVNTAMQQAAPLLPWPRGKLLWFGIGFITLLLTLMYRQDFFFARSIYGIAAALHAYIEIPMLLWAFSLTCFSTHAARRESSRPLTI